jgi:hypothetical protein
MYDKAEQAIGELHAQFVEHKEDRVEHHYPEVSLFLHDLEVGLERGLEYLLEHNLPDFCEAFQFAFEMHKNYVKFAKQYE